MRANMCWSLTTCLTTSAEASMSGGTKCSWARTMKWRRYYTNSRERVQRQKKSLQKKEEELGREQFLTTARNIVLQTLDMLWVEHLESMEYLRGSVNLRAYGQRDPLTEYRKEGDALVPRFGDDLVGRAFELLEGLTKDKIQGAATPMSTPAPAPSVIAARGGSHQAGRNWPQRPVPLWFRQKVEKMRHAEYQRTSGKMAKKEMKKVQTLCVVYQPPRVLLGMKKRGFGQGRWNGFGGNVIEGETIENAARREVLEEAGIQVGTIEKMGVILFEFQGKPDTPEVHIFKTNEFTGEPKESDEMRPQWFEESDIPYERDVG